MQRAENISLVFLDFSFFLFFFFLIDGVKNFFTYFFLQE